MTSQTRTQTTANSIINTFVEDIFDKGDGNDLLFSGCHYHPLRSLPSPDTSLKWWGMAMTICYIKCIFLITKPPTITIQQ